jgi:hypothetical protein
LATHSTSVAVPVPPDPPGVVAPDPVGAPLAAPLLGTALLTAPLLSAPLPVALLGAADDAALDAVVGATDVAPVVGDGLVAPVQAPSRAASETVAAVSVVARRNMDPSEMDTVMRRHGVVAASQP